MLKEIYINLHFSLEKFRKNVDEKIIKIKLYSPFHHHASVEC